ncbi:hypothetical protein N9488_00965 [Flavobacteriales bacterium]|nr:hypothetical protein [Flavobacteriales bacterium]MDG1175084.1 hypothetical protein [Flavobacteriales bacterium]
MSIQAEKEAKNNSAGLGKELFVSGVIPNCISDSFMRTLAFLLEVDVAFIE